jgi:hypothetical protein
MKAMSTISNQLKDDVNKVFNYYEVSLEEAKFEKKRIMDNLYEASKCYSIIAAGIRGLEK